MHARRGRQKQENPSTNPHCAQHYSSAVGESLSSELKIGRLGIAAGAGQHCQSKRLPKMNPHVPTLLPLSHSPALYPHPCSHSSAPTPPRTPLFPLCSRSSADSGRSNGKFLPPARSRGREGRSHWPTRICSQHPLTRFSPMSCAVLNCAQ